MGLAADWKAAKKVWEQKGSPHVRQEAHEVMGAFGWGEGDFGKLLASFDNAKDMTARRAAWARANKVLGRYTKGVDKALKVKNQDPRGKQGLRKLEVTLANLRAQGEAACQDPEPGKRSTELKIVSKMNLAAGLKPKHLDVGKLTVTAWIEMDEELLRLEKEGELGFHWSEIQTEVSTFLDDAKARFKDTIVALDNKLDSDAELLLDDKAREKKLREGNEVLAYYAKLVERRINEITEGYWKKAGQRRQYLKDFEFGCKMDIFMGSLTIAVSTASLIASFGTAGMNIFVLAKAAADIALTLNKLNRDADTVKQKLAPMMDDILETWRKKEKEDREGSRGVARQAGQTAREFAGQVIGPWQEKLFTTATRTTKVAKEYAGKLTKVEAQAGKLYKKIDELTSKFPSAPDGPTAESSKAMRDAHFQFLKAALEYEAFAKELRAEIAWAEKAVRICDEVRDHDDVPRLTATSGVLVKTGLGIFAVIQLGLRFGGVNLPLLT